MVFTYRTKAELIVSFFPPIEIMATTWDLFDSFNALEATTAETISGALTTVAGKSAAVKEHDKAMSLGSVETGIFTYYIKFPYLLSAKSRFT